MNTKSSLPKPVIIFLVIIAAAFLLSILSGLKGKSSTSPSPLVGSACSQFSNKDGYTGCMSLTNGKNKRCKFKVDNKINEATQKMEFQYTCIEK